MSCENALKKSAESLRSGAVLEHASPSGLRAQEANHQVQLEWDKVDGATGYTLYWSTTPITALAEANAISLTTNSYTHTGLQNGKAIYYSVVAHGFDTESRGSEAVIAVPHQYMLYVTNGGVGGSDCNAVGYTLNGDDGSLVELGGYPFDVGSYPKRIATDPLRRFAYISSFNTQKITCYTIDSDAGKLAPIGSPVAAGTGVSSLAVDPSGKYLYAVNSTDIPTKGSSVLSYSIDQSTGSLNLISRYDFATGAQPNSIAIDPTGRFVYVPIPAAGDGIDVVVFEISGTGALAKLPESIEVNPGVTGIAMHPKGKFLYLTFWNGSSDVAVQALTLNTSTGLLLAGQATRTYSIPGNNNQAEVVEIDPTGRFLYVCLYSKTKIAIYSIDQTSGDLTPLSGSPFQLWPVVTPAELPNAIGFDPEGKFAYIVTALANTPNTGALRCFSIDQETGALSAVGSPRTLGKNSCDIEIISLP